MRLLYINSIKKKGFKSRSVLTIKSNKLSILLSNYFKALAIVLVLQSLSPLITYSQTGLQFNGTNQYVTFGVAPNLATQNFTVEAWFKRTGTGTSNSTGSGGITILPILTKGSPEADNSVVDANYILGINTTSNVIAADFEEGTGSASPGLNHPLSGTTVIVNDIWYHAGATFSNGIFSIYLNGVLENSTNYGVNVWPQGASTQHAAIGTMIQSNGTTLAGFFAGIVDEARIWNNARTQTQIQINMNVELTSGTGLLGRWGLNEGSGNTAANSIGGSPAGTLVNTPTWVTAVGFPAELWGLKFNGSNQHVTFGPAPQLNTTSFTLEAWIKIEGIGVTTVTSGGADGLIGAESVIPIIAKGRGEGESPNEINMNYIMGITAGNILVADFEESTGPNHKAIGTNAIPNNVWTHIAASYGGGTWNLYINGVLDKTENETGPGPVSNSAQHASIGTAMTSNGTAAGYFAGSIDEARIWNVARTQVQIQSNFNQELTSGTGLIGRWSFDEGSGTVATNSIGSPNGIIVNNPNWVFGAPFSTVINLPPAAPTNPSPADNTGAASTSPTLCATVSDPEASNLTVKFYGRKKVNSGAKFTIIALPDTQFYTEEPQGTNSGGGGHNGIFKAQTQWIADHRVDSSVAFVIQLGDCVQNGDNPPGVDKEIEWKRADTSMKKIENPNVPITDGIPYGICVGNHDQQAIGDPDGATLYYNQYFGTSRFSGRAYYGGHYGSNNDNHYELFSASGVDFIQISIEYYANGTTPSLQPVLDWADALLKTYSNRKGIISTHNMLNTSNNFQGPGQKIYDDLKDNPNLMLMLCGHVAGQGRRTDVFNGNTVHTLLADYQNGYTNGGNGYLRIMQFLPDQNLLKVKTYSPYSNTSLTGTSSDFTLPVKLTESFQLIGTNTNVASGSQTCMPWPTLNENSAYEWYVEVSDGVNTTTGPVWNFTTPFLGPLPVTIINFNARAENNKVVKVSWTTSYEKDNSYFEVQRSKDGLNFTSIGRVNGANNSNSLVDYTFYDNNPYNGISFYRLKQVDIDTRSTFTRIERVNITDTKTTFDIFPNPVSGNTFNINFLKEIQGSIVMKIYNMRGQLQLQQNLNGANTYTIDHRLSKGMYTVSISGNGFTETKKLIIQ